MAGEQNARDPEQKSGRYTEVVGTFYTDAANILKNIAAYAGEAWGGPNFKYHHLFLVLVPETENEYDPNAIRVESQYGAVYNDAPNGRNGKIGYLPKETAKLISLHAPITVRACVKEKSGRLYVKVNLTKLLPLSNVDEKEIFQANWR